MPGIPGAGGPVPKRDEERRRRNDPANGPADHVDINTLPDYVKDPVVMPPASEHWNDFVKGLYESAGKSGMVAFYEPTDWAQLLLLCENMDRELADQMIYNKDGEVVGEQRGIIKGASLSAYLKALGELGFSEGARRRMRVEIHRAPEGPAAPVLSLEDQRRGLLG